MATPVTRPQHPWRFGFVYAGLVLCVGIAAGVAAVIVTRPTPPAWSSWRPQAHDGGSAVRQIAGHVATEYQLPSGGKLDTIRALVPATHSGKAFFPVVAPDLSLSGQSLLASLNARQTRLLNVPAAEYSLCGPNSSCANPPGDASVAEALQRRQALELALLTFRYVPDEQTVVVMLPGSTDGPPARVLVLPRSDAAHALSQERLKLPGASGKTLSRRAAFDIATATDPYVYAFKFTAVQTTQGQIPMMVASAPSADPTAGLKAPTTTATG